MMDYTMAREHFVDMGEQMHRHIYDINLAWGHMLDFYTDLNNARKEKDDSYADQNFIGEEVIEPDEPGTAKRYDNSTTAGSDKQDSNSGLVKEESKEADG